MTNLDLLDRHRYLYLEDIGEPRDGTLRLLIAEGRVADGPTTTAGPVTGCSPIVADDDSIRYEVVFTDYVAYAVRNESYVSIDKDEAYTGTLGRTYSRSKFLDFVVAATFASPEYPGSFVHYEVACLNHIVDVASLKPPELRIIEASR